MIVFNEKEFETVEEAMVAFEEHLETDRA